MPRKISFSLTLKSVELAGQFKTLISCSWNKVLITLAQLIGALSCRKIQFSRHIWFSSSLKSVWQTRLPYLCAFHASRNDLKFNLSNCTKCHYTSSITSSGVTPLILISIRAIKVEFLLIRKQYGFPFLVPYFVIFSEGQFLFFMQFLQLSSLLSPLPFHANLV